MASPIKKNIPFGIHNEQLPLPAPLPPSPASIVFKRVVQQSAQDSSPPRAIKQARQESSKKSPQIKTKENEAPDDLGALQNTPESFLTTLRLAVNLQSPLQLKKLLNNPLALLIDEKAWKELLFLAGTKEQLQLDSESIVGILLNYPNSTPKERLTSVLAGAAQKDNKPLIEALCRLPSCTTDVLTDVFMKIDLLSPIAPWFASEYGTEIVHEASRRVDNNLLEKWIEIVNDLTIRRVVMPMIVNQPGAVLRLIPLLDGRNWVQDSSDVTHILDTLITHFTPAHTLLEVALWNEFKDRHLKKSDINFLIQKIASPENGMQAPLQRRAFQTRLVCWLLENNHNPTPFSWAQAVQKFAEQNRPEMVIALWKAARADVLPPAKLSAEWRHIMMQQFKSDSSQESAYINLLPFFFAYNHAEDTLGREDLAELVKYKMYNESNSWINALAVAVSENHQRATYLLLSPAFMDQMDSKTLVQAIRLLEEYGKYDLLSEFSIKVLNKLPTIDLNNLIVESRNTIRWQPEVRKLEQRMGSIVRTREREEEEASKSHFGLLKE